ncbi:MAG: HEPN domain-containing protein [Bacillota bacterium]|nr:HEPN domain-containing protein [Bacillota bacterium]MDW7682868.1 HEPN domain-containing protein [Bacillota bacterium]
MDDKIRVLCAYRLNKAKEDLDTAKIALNHNKCSQSVNRSYYAIFHAVRALLAVERFDSKKHSAIISQFNQLYIATGKIDKEYYKLLASAFDIRNKSDYHNMVSHQVCLSPAYLLLVSCNLNFYFSIFSFSI